MIKVNLLPHRQIRRAERQREFGLMASLVAIAAAAIVFVSWSYISAQIRTQQERNQRLQDEMMRLDKEIAIISTLKDQIKHVLERKQIVEGLQSDRNQAVQILDELARLLPEGVSLKSIKQVESEIELKGIADTNSRVASLVHNLSGSSVIHNPNLVEIQASNSGQDIKIYEFVIRVTLIQEPPADNQAEQKTASPKG
ncbi:MAG: PilN domain-containing protein [Methylophilus sp.]|jgi:type IV pilus assembly protein PilN|uniref:PilN domain-containing protein n=1 Tax=Methylophilus sp. TaxID=29541 RepID=UPI002BD20575|nr:PilN domain-containing protein [Methylophilus sp.]HSH87517.1 PilN domain-containing protein [Methylophilus sp.]